MEVSALKISGVAWWPITATGCQTIEGYDPSQHPIGMDMFQLAIWWLTSPILLSRPGSWISQKVIYEEYACELLVVSFKTTTVTSISLQ